MIVVLYGGWRCCYLFCLSIQLIVAATTATAITLLSPYIQFFHHFNTNSLLLSRSFCVVLWVRLYISHFRVFNFNCVDSQPHAQCKRTPILNIEKSDKGRSKHTHIKLYTDTKIVGQMFWNRKIRRNKAKSQTK